MKGKWLVLALVLLCLALVLVLPGKAQAATSGYYTYTVSGGKATITGCDTSISGDVELPSTLGGCPVYEIDAGAFENCSKLTSVTFSDSIVYIGKGAFQNCSGLTSVTFSDSIRNIGVDAFKNCTGLTSLDLPVYSDIGQGAFSGCSNLVSIKAPKVHTTVSTGDEYGGYEYNLYPFGSLFGTDAYSGGVATKQIYRHVIGSEDRDDDEQYTDYSITYYIPASLKTVIVTSDVKDYAFYNCSGLETVALEKWITVIGYKAFTGCNLNQVIYCGTESQWAALAISSGNTPLTDAPRSYHMPDATACTEMPVCAICGQQIGTQPLGHSYENGVCIYCGIRKPIASGDLGENLRWSLDDTGTLTISGYGTMPDYNHRLGDPNYGAPGDYNLDEDADDPLKAPWGNYASKVCNVVIENGTTYIGSEVFYGCYNLTSVTIPESVTAIGKNAFARCGKLERVMLPDSVTSLGDGAFRQCSGLVEVHLGNGVSNVGAGVFYQCTGLQTATLSARLGSIADGMFSYCSSLTSVVIPEGVTSIGYSAFSKASELKEVHIPKSVTQIGAYAFYRCTKLERLYLQSVAAWCTMEFAEEGRLSRTYYNNPMYASEQNVTVSLNGQLLTDLVIPEGVTTVADYAFENCAGLRTVQIPGSVRYIGTAAFSGGTLESVIYCGTESQWAKISMGRYNSPLTDAPRSYHKPGAATCTEAAICALCGQSVGEPLDHSYENGICTVCGALEPPPLQVSGISRAKNLSLKDVVYMKATVAFETSGGNADLTKEEILKNGKILFWREKDLPEGAATADNATLVQALTDGGVYDDGIQEYYAYSYGIAPAEYGDTIYYRTYLVIDGMEYYGEINEYSVLTYANNQFKRESSTLKPLLAAMLNYGAAAQVKFGYKTENLANAGLQTWVNAGVLDESYLTMQWNEKLLNIPFAPSEEMTVNFRQNGAKRTARTLVLQGMVQPKLTFAYNIVGDKGTKLPEGGTVTFYYWSAEKFNSLEDESRPLTKLNATYTVTGADVLQTYTDKYGYEYAVSLAGIPAKYLGNAIYVAAVFTMQDGTEYCSGVEVYSPEMYAKSMLSKDTTTEVTANLLKWMVIYGEEAKNYYAD